MRRKGSHIRRQLLFSEFIRYLWGYRQVVVFVPLLALVLSIIVCKFVVAPGYSSTTKLYVCPQGNSKLDYFEIRSGSILVQDYKDIIIQRDILKDIIADLDLDMTYEELLENIHVSVPANTRIINVTVIHTNPFVAKEIADRIRDKAVRKINKIYSKETLVTVEKAYINDSPVSPDTTKCAVLVFVTVFFAVLVLLAIIFVNKVNTAEDIDKHFDVGVLAELPCFKEKTVFIIRSNNAQCYKSQKGRSNNGNY